jgi:calcium binding protein 39
MLAKFYTYDTLPQSVKHFPDWGKMRFVEYPAKPWPAILDETSNLAVDFVSRLVQYEGGRRMIAAKV